MKSVLTKDVLTQRLEIFFNSEYYKDRYPDVEAFNGSPLEHYFKHGCHELRKPNAWYSDDMVPSDLSLENAGTPLFIVFLTYLPNLTESAFEQLCFSKITIEKGHDKCWQCTIMREHFNSKYYRRKYPELQHVPDALIHFCEEGWKELRNPTANFDTSYYLTTNNDVASADINPFVHYISQPNEGRLPREASIVKKQLLRSMRSANKISSDYSKISPIVSLVDKNHLFINLFALEKKICVSVCHDNYLNHTGGIQNFVKNESSIAQKKGFSYLNLFPSSPNNKLVQGNGNTLLINVHLDDRFLGTYTAFEISEVLKSIELKKPSISFSTGVIHSVMGWNVTALIEIFSLSMNKIFYYVHDYFPLCQEYRLLRNNVEPCNAPSMDSTSCSICIHGAERQTHLHQFNQLFVRLKPELIFPSSAAEHVFKNASPNYKLVGKVIPHIDVIKVQKKIKKDKSLKHKIRFAFCGQPTSQKGFFHFQELVNRCTEEEYLEFFHFGSASGHISNVTYVNTILKNGVSQLTDMLVKHKIDIVFLPSIWRETFNYIAYESAKAGAAVITLNNSGNIADFVAKHGIGAVVDDEMAAAELMCQKNIWNKLDAWKHSISSLVFSNNESFFSIKG